ncbi:MAG: crossover junction endodeoxyribonuclease RuvC [Planctomycetota bacterium]
MKNETAAGRRSSAGASRVLGIDPGLAKVGWGIVDEQAGRLTSIACGVIKTSSGTSHCVRLETIHAELTRIIEEFRPMVAAIEEVFQGKSVRSALLAGEGRGVCILAAAQRQLKVHEYPATVVKLAVTGNGRAAKVQVQSMIDRLLGPARDSDSLDASDALAVALTHIQRCGSVRAGTLVLR